MIQLETVGTIRKIGINRPEKKNALTATMYSDLADALISAENDADVRVVVLHGSEECFTAGNDLNDFVSDPPTGAESPVYRFLSAISSAKKPVLAGVAGHAVGIGTTAQLHCDLVVAAANATFHLPFVDLGLCPEAGASVLLPATIGLKRASELLLLGTPFSADEALQMGFVNQVVESGTVIAAVTEIAQALAAKSPSSVRQTKSLLKTGFANLVQSTMAAEAKEFVRLLNSPEAQKAFAAFTTRKEK